MIVFWQQQFFFRFDPFDLSEIPRLGLDGLQLGHVIGRDVTLLPGGFAPSQPPVTLGVVEDLQVFAFPEAQVFVGARVVVVQRHEDLGRRVGGVGRLLVGHRGHWSVPHLADAVVGRHVLYGNVGHGRRRGVLAEADVGRRARRLLLAGRAPLAAEAATHLRRRGRSWSPGVRRARELGTGGPFKRRRASCWTAERFRAGKATGPGRKRAR